MSADDYEMFGRGSNSMSCYCMGASSIVTQKVTEKLNCHVCMHGDFLLLFGVFNQGLYMHDKSACVTDNGRQ